MSSGKTFADALQPELLQIDARQLGFKRPTRRGNNLDRAGANCRLIFIRIGKRKNAARRHRQPFRGATRSV